MTDLSDISRLLRGARSLTTMLAGAALTALPMQALYAAEPTPFTQCQACHAVGPNAQHGVGPQLNGVFGRKIGSIEDYTFSAAMSAAGSAGKAWNEDSLDALLTNPTAFIPGTRMAAVVANRTDRAAIIATLIAVKADGSGAPAATADPPVPPEVLALQGDPAYGEYLSSNCVTCHQADGSNQGMPSITGWPVPAFVTTMHAYKSKARANPVMQNIAGALNDDEIAALAAWFTTQ